MSQVTLVSRAGANIVGVVHRKSDPTTWIVTRWRRYFLFKVRVQSEWFNDRMQALEFAQQMLQRSADPGHDSGS